jgi:ABC-type lipoprotein export system ATPase subunit
MGLFSKKKTEDKNPAGEKNAPEIIVMGEKSQASATAGSAQAAEASATAGPAQATEVSATAGPAQASEASETTSSDKTSEASETTSSAQAAESTENAEAGKGAAEVNGEKKDDEDVPYIKCDSLVRIFKSEGIEVMALQGLDLEIQRGELTAIIGKSGSGKSTLLNLLGALDKPSAGYVAYDGVNIAELSEKQLAKFRSDHIGFVWQKNTDNLLNYLTVAENVEMPLLFTGLTKKEKRERALKMLDAVGLAHKEKAFPTMLSGGEQQRVAIATALVNEPELLLMDEPTGAVDRKTSIMLQDLFREINRKLGVTIIIVTHDISLADRVDRVVMISDGKISSERILKDEYRRKIEAGETMLKEGLAPGAAVEEANAGLGAGTGVSSSENDSHEEFSILDKAGRVRLSAEMREAVGIDSNRVKIDIVDGKIVISKE